MAARAHDHGPAFASWLNHEFNAMLAALGEIFVE